MSAEKQKTGRKQHEDRGLGHLVIEGRCANYPLSKVEITGRSLRSTGILGRAAYRVRVRLTIAPIEDLEEESLSGWLYL